MSDIHLKIRYTGGGLMFTRKLHRMLQLLAVAGAVFATDWMKAAEAYYQWTPAAARFYHVTVVGIFGMAQYVLGIAGHNRMPDGTRITEEDE